MPEQPGRHVQGSDSTFTPWNRRCSWVNRGDKEKKRMDQKESAPWRGKMSLSRRIGNSSDKKQEDHQLAHASQEKERTVQEKILVKSVNNSPPYECVRTKYNNLTEMNGHWCEENEADSGHKSNKTCGQHWKWKRWNVKLPYINGRMVSRFKKDQKGPGEGSSEGGP